MPYSPALKTLIEAVGGAQNLADHLDVSLSAVQHWRDVPAHHILKAAQIAKLDPTDIRPDLVEGRRKSRRGSGAAPRDGAAA